MIEDKINSNESEGAFNEFVEDQVENLIDDIINEGDMEQLGTGDSQIVIEMDDITPPVFEFDSGGGGGAGGRGRKPGKEGDKIKFTLPYRRFLELVARKLGHLRSIPEQTRKPLQRIFSHTYVGFI